jgi:type I restriction enzyme, S subunit
MMAGWPSHFTGKGLNAYRFPLPPIAEQRRIVIKVDELMAFCDRLEAARAEREAMRDRLTGASLARLNAPDPDTFRGDVRFALHALPALTARADQIRQLRQIILNLAVRGKLVPQDPNDEPAVVEGGRQAANTELPFAVPFSWRWCEFAQVAKFENGDRGKNYPNRWEYVEKGIPWINTGHIQPDGSLSIASMNYITREKFGSLGGGKIKPDDLIYCLRGATFGKTAFVKPFTEGAIASSLMIIRPGPSVDRRFTYCYLISPLGISQLLRFDNGTAQPNLSSGNVKKYLIPVPPLAEQHRIVAKVDELMAFCDRLEAGLAGAEATRARLLEALLAEALAPAEQLDLEAAE